MIRAVIAMQNVEETNLAWALIDAAKPHLNATECEMIFIIVGAGDTFGAIRRLFKLFVTKQIPLRAELVKRCNAWLDAYACHEEEQYLRRLIAGFWIGGTTQTARSARLPAIPKPTERLGV